MCVLKKKENKEAVDINRVIYFLHKSQFAHVANFPTYNSLMSPCTIRMNGYLDFHQCKRRGGSDPGLHAT